jgi:glycosyltransferase involved in cell wall biosynthesis
MKNNILLVSDYPIAEVMGGAVRVLYEQGSLLAKRGHSVHLLTREEKFKKGYSNIFGVKEWKYKTDSRNSFTFLKSTVSNSKKIFESVVDKFSIDNIIFYQPFSAYGILKSKRCNSINKIYSCFSFSFEEYRSRNNPPTDLVKRVLFEMEILIRKKWEAKVLRKSAYIVALSRFTEDKLRKVYSISQNQIKIIPGGVDLDRFKPAQDKIVIRKRLKVPTDKIILLCVRNLVKRMGLENLVCAINLIAREVPDICVIIGGEGAMKAYLKDLVKKLNLEQQIKIVGFIHENLLSDYYSMSDFFILPTKELEGFGLVTLEAMACGLPVLGTPVGGTKEILGKFDSRFLFKGSDSNSIAESILENYKLVKKDPQKWFDFSIKCRNFVERRYSWEANIVSLEKLLTKDAVN